MRVSAMFQPDAKQVDELVRRHPLAQVVSSGPEGFHCTPLPMLLQVNPDSPGERLLLGHFARSNPHVEALRKRPRALFVFMGLHAYVSPSWLDDRTQAPTWNYSTVQMEADVEFCDTQAAALDAVQRLTEHMERDRPHAWQVHEMGARLPRLIDHVVAFRAVVRAEAAKFKLGQNERADVRAQIIEAFDRTEHRALATQMRAFNPN